MKKAWFVPVLALYLLIHSTTASCADLSHYEPVSLSGPIAMSERDEHLLDISGKDVHAALNPEATKK